MLLFYLGLVIIIIALCSHKYSVEMNICKKPQKSNHICSTDLCPLIHKTEAVVVILKSIMKQ